MPIRPEVNLLFLVDNVKYGGFAVYTAHLLDALKKSGYDPRIFKIRKRTHPKPTDFTHGHHAWLYSIEDMKNLVKGNGRTLICCTYWKQYEREIVDLLRVGASIVIHDPTEYHDGLFAALKRYRSKIVVIRPTNRDNLRAIGLRPTFIQHPYVRASLEERRILAPENAVAFSRVDWDKHTDLIIKANRKLSPAHRCTIYGELNRIYAYHKLDKDFEGWRDYYKGTFPTHLTAAVELALSANFVVDMSAISKDGGGTQYTFLESWDAERPLVVNRKWFTGSQTDALREGENCLAASDDEELVKILTGDPDDHENVVEGGLAALEHHSPKTVVPLYQEALSW